MLTRVAEIMGAAALDTALLCVAAVVMYWTVIWRARK